MKRIQLIIALVCASFLSSCQTTTRFGDWLIPPHPNSYKAKDEKVVFVVQEIGDKNTRGGDPAAFSAQFGVIAAKWLLDQAQKKVAEEMRNEAKKYTQQYSGRLRREFTRGVYHIAMLRLVPGKPSSIESPQGSLTAIIEEKQRTESITVASAVLLELSVTGENPYGYLDLKEVYLSKAKAKVVGLSGWPWHWLGAVVLKTGDLVKMDVHVKVKGISEKGTIVVVDDDFPAGGHKMKLGKPSIKMIENEGDWLPFGKMGGKIPLTIDIRVTETDPSNVQKVLTDAADKVETSTALKDMIPNGN